MNLSYKTFTFFIFLFITSINLSGQCTAGWCYDDPAMPSITLTADPGANPQDTPCLNPG
jgi:hypothetical protein